MINYNQIFNDDTLNIFTDASMRMNDKENIGSPGYVAVIGNKIIDKKAIVFRETSNQFVEVYAILMAIQYIISNREKVKVINIFSDSQFAVYSLREWIFKWMNGMKNDRLYNSAGKLVAHQNIIMNIIYTIIEYNLDINIYHNRGHFKKDQINEFIALFKKHNFLNDSIDYKSASSIIYYNDIIDNYTRQTLYKDQVLNLQKLEVLDYFANDNLDLQQYKKLLNIN